MKKIQCKKKGPKIRKYKSLFDIKRGNRKENNITSRICQALREVMLMRDGKLKELSMDELLSIQEGLEDVEDGRTYKMQKEEDLTDFLKRAEPCECKAF